MLYVLDSSAVLNDFGFEFSAEDSYVTTGLVLAEFRDLRSRHLVDNALKNGLLSVVEPEKQNTNYVEEFVAGKGFDKLSLADKSILSLGFSLKKQGKDFLLITDDFSIQNFCSLMEIPFEGVLRGEIGQKKAFSIFCPGCKKAFSPGFSGRKCDVCGSLLARKSQKNKQKVTN